MNKVLGEIDTRQSLLRFMIPCFGIVIGVMFLLPDVVVYSNAPKLYEGLDSVPKWLLGWWSLLAGLVALIAEVMSRIVIRLVGAIIQCSFFAVIALLFLGHSPLGVAIYSVFFVFKALHTIELVVRSGGG